jgi:tRNA 5-methylaminomethyl-2-thiouridine biosynthesis bifunctional protein
VTIDQLSWLNQDQPFSNIFQDVYFDSANGLAESKYVFIKNNNLVKRFNQLGPQDQFVIGETGFGTGLNFLSVVRLWHKLITNDAKLHYIAFEKKPLNPEQMQRALKKWPILFPYLDKLLAHYPCRYSAFHQFSFSSQIYVTLVFKDVTDGLSQTYDFVDAWFLDGFAPSKNPSMWQKSVFFHMARLSHLNTTVATFTSSGHVRRSLADFGFVPRKVKGFQNKREMLVAYYSPTKNQRYFTISPYYKPSKTSNLKSKHIAVIGAGLAGLACAYELSFSTHRIDIYEQGQAIASGASCCPAGILKPYLTVDGNASEVFHTTGFIQMQKLCHAFKLQYPELIYSQGVFQPLMDRIDKRRFEKLFAQSSASLAYLISPERFAELTGTSSHYGGIYYPSALSVNVHLLCQIIYKQLGNNAHLYTGACVDDIHLNNADGAQKWCVKANNKNHYYDNVILASGYQTVKRFHQTQHLPLYTSIGQSTFLSNGDKVKCNLIDKGYLIPLLTMNIL